MGRVKAEPPWTTRCPTASIVGPLSRKSASIGPRSSGLSFGRSLLVRTVSVSSSTRSFRLLEPALTTRMCTRPPCQSRVRIDSVPRSASMSRSDDPVQGVAELPKRVHPEPGCPADRVPVNDVVRTEMGLGSTSNWPSTARVRQGSDELPLGVPAEATASCRIHALRHELSS